MLRKRSAIGLAILVYIAPPIFAQAVPQKNDAGNGNAAANPALWPAAASPPAFTDPATEAAISAILAKMTLEQKIGQMIQADISAVTPEDFARYPLGAVLAGGNSGPNGNERASAAQWRQLVNDLRDASRKSGAGIPILFGIDAVHGHSNLPQATIFPHNIGLGAAHDPDLMQRIGAATAAEVSGSGIEWTFAPTLAVPQDYRWGRTYEGYSSDPALVAAYARAMTLGLQGKLTAGQPLGKAHVAATAKHFVADGGTADGRDQGDTRMSESELIARHAQGYPAAIDAGSLTVMVSFSSWNGVKNHGNKSLLTGVLKERMGFSGLILGDWNGHGKVPGCSVNSCPDAINAGLDIFMAPDSWKMLFASTLSAAREGKIAMARIDDAVRRILRVKYKLGLMGDTPVSRGDISQVGAPEHLQLAREAAAKSLVLLKNNKAVLPIRSGANVLIAGPAADNMAMQAGGWTITWQGGDTTASDFANGQTIGRAIASAVKDNGGNAELSVQGSYTVKPDIAVIVMGENPYAEFEGDVPHLAFQAKPAEEALIKQLKSQNIPVVIVFLSGRPLFAGKLINQADAFVAAWLPGTQGGGVADVLVAQKNGKAARDFTGRLPFAWPADAKSPVAKPLFPVGYGLDYSRAVTLARVNEKPNVVISPLDQAAVYLRRGKIPAPWFLAIDGSISNRPIDLSAQEDAQQFIWNANGTLGINGPKIDLSKALTSGSALSIEWRIDQAAAGPVLLSLGEAALNISATINAKPAGSVLQTKLPLRCFSEAGSNLNAVTSPLKIEAPKGFTATIRNVSIIAGDGAAACPAKAK